MSCCKKKLSADLDESAGNRIILILELAVFSIMDVAL